MTQYARPDSEISKTNWSNAYTDIDEVTPNDGDYLLGADDFNGTVEVGLSNVNDPESDADHIVKYRIWDEGQSFSRGIETRLVQGTTVLATWTDTELDHTVEQKEHTLSSGEADSITDYTDLRLRFTSTGDTGTPAPNRSFIYLSWAVLELPDGEAPPPSDVSVLAMLGVG